MSIEAKHSDIQELESLRRLTLISVALALILSVPSSLAFFAAFGGDVEAAVFGHPAAILGRGASAAALLRLAAILDMFYSYLLLVPLVVLLHRRLRPIRPWLADVGAAGGLAYIVVGATGAAILATAGSSLVAAYETATPAEVPAITTSFELVRQVVYFALWQTLDPITAGVWVGSVGWLLLPARRLIAPLLVAVGIALFALSVLTMLGIHSLTALSSVLIVVVLVWTTWLVARQLQDRHANPARHSEDLPLDSASEGRSDVLTR